MNFLQRRFADFRFLNNENSVVQKAIFARKWLFSSTRIIKHVIITFQSTFTSMKLTALSVPQWKCLTWNIKLSCQNLWNYLFFIQNILIVGVIALSISNSWTSIETKWYLVLSSIDTKHSIFKRKFQLKQQIFHCSKKLEMAKTRESSFITIFPLVNQWKTISIWSQFLWIRSPATKVWKIWSFQNI